MERAISINVKPRARCTAGNYSFHRKSQQRGNAEIRMMNDQARMTKKRAGDRRLPLDFVI